MRALGSMRMARLADGIREFGMSVPAAGLARIPSRCVAILARHSAPQSRMNLTQSRNSLTESRNSLAEFRNFFKKFPKNDPDLSNFWSFSPLKPVFSRLGRFLGRFPGGRPAGN